jgi:glycosyltransferase involved in cell wall biosynthesis
MITCHLLTPSIDPSLGGLQLSSHRIAQILGEQGNEVVVYTTEQPASDTKPDHISHVEHLSATHDVACEPLNYGSTTLKESSNSRLALELPRAEFAILLDRISRRMGKQGKQKHVLISFYASYHGFIAQQLSYALNIPHIACIRGSDFTKDFVSPFRFSSVEYVARRATKLVATNRSQKEILDRIVGRGSSTVVIHNSLPASVNKYLWRPVSSDCIKLISDCGFAFKKQPHVLANAALRLLKSGTLIELSIIGRTEPREEAYWREASQQWFLESGGLITANGYLPAEEIRHRLSQAHIYCSASLGEGCSNAMLQAAGLGIPIVCTNVGAVPEILEEHPLSMLQFPVADPESAATAILEMISRVRSGDAIVPSDVLDRFRLVFARIEESRQWADVIRGVLNADMAAPVRQELS